MGLSAAVRNSMLDTYFGAGSVYAGLTDSADAEPAGGDYARVEVRTTDWNAAASGELANAVPITFPAPTGNWGTMAKGKLFSAASGGSELASGDLTVAIAVNVGGAEPEFLASAFRVRVT